MKKTFRLFYAAVAAIAFASCADTMDNDINMSKDADLVHMTFSASMSEDVDSKTTYLSRKVYWEATDAITVFSVGETVAKTSFAEPELLENRTIARFSGLADASAETYYAVYPHSEANTYNDGTFSVTFPAEQTAVANGFESGSNVSVAVSTEQNLQFKNVGALLAFSFKDLETALNTASVTFKAKKNDTEYWGLAGTTTFTLDENSLPVAVEGDVQEVVVNAPEGGFNTGVSYFIPVIPVGACTGMEVYYTDLDDEEHIKKNDVDFELLRSYMFNVGQLRNPYDIELPEDFEIMLDFTKGWPFVETCVSEDAQKADASGGEVYTYMHPLEGTNLRKALDFEIANATYNYDLASKVFTISVDVKIRLAAIEDYYLKSVEIAHNLSGKLTNRYSLMTGTMDGHPYLTSAYCESYNPVKYTFYSDKLVTTGNASQTSTAMLPTLGQVYWLWSRHREIPVRYLHLTYSSTSPGPAPTAAATSAE